MSPLKQYITKKGQVDKDTTKLNAGNNKRRKYKIKVIQENAVYVKESKGHLAGLYYLMSLKKYPEKENI